MMKKLNFLFILIFLLAAISSCEKAGRLSIEMRDNVPYTGNAIPVFEYGNVNCEDVVLPEGLVRVDPYTTGRINYLGDGKFEKNWPTGLIVTVRDNKFVDFSLTDEASYCIGAVIVKGGNGAMVYTYSSGTRGDTGLTSPINASGKPADLSNLTFCFVQCKELVVAVKSKFYGDYSCFGVSPGNLIPSNLISESGWCGDFVLGYIPYVPSSSFKLYRAGMYEEVGKVEIDENGDIKVIAKYGLILDWTYLFVGEKDALLSTNLDADGCPKYYVIPPWQLNDIDGTTQSFDLP